MQQAEFIGSQVERPAVPARLQRREIDQMRWLLEDIDANDVAATQAEAETRPIPEFEGTVNPATPTPGE